MVLFLIEQTQMKIIRENKAPLTLPPRVKIDSAPTISHNCPFYIAKETPKRRTGGAASVRRIKMENSTLRGKKFLMNPIEFNQLTIDLQN